MTRAGQVFELPTRAHLIAGLGFSLSLTQDDEGLLRTPSAIEGAGGANSAAMKKSKGRMLMVRDQMADLAYANGLKVSETIGADAETYDAVTALLPTVQAAQGDNRNSNIWERDPAKPQNLENALFHLLPTPNTMDMLPARTPEQKLANKGKGGYANVRETVVNELLPTPKARDSQAEGYEAGLRRAPPQVGTIVKGLVDGDDRVLFPTPAARDPKDSTKPHERDGIVQTDTITRAIFNSGEVELLPTTRVSMGNGPTQKEITEGNPKSRIETEVMLGATNWGKFAPAIERWENVLGRPAPAPTKPDGKDGSHRLSSAFTEWLMGLPEGWITDAGLTRNEELKACGNGVVPQQAELALRILLEGINLTEVGGAT
jgi:DNA (cytosine-5)-methyltransferase 1